MFFFMVQRWFHRLLLLFLLLFLLTLFEWLWHVSKNLIISSEFWLHCLCEMHQLWWCGSNWILMWLLNFDLHHSYQTAIKRTYVFFMRCCRIVQSPMPTASHFLFGEFYYCYWVCIITYWTKMHRDTFAWKLFLYSKKKSAVITLI